MRVRPGAGPSCPTTGCYEVVVDAADPARSAPGGPTGSASRRARATSADSPGSKPAPGMPWRDGVPARPRAQDGEEPDPLGRLGRRPRIAGRRCHACSGPRMRRSAGTCWPIPRATSSACSRRRPPDRSCTAVFEPSPDRGKLMGYAASCCGERSDGLGLVTRHRSRLASSRSGTDRRLRRRGGRCSTDAHAGAARSVRRLVLLVTASALIVTPQLIALPAAGRRGSRAGDQAQLGAVRLRGSGGPRPAAVVLDAKTGELLYSRYGKRSAIPASNTKIVTAVAAMHILGADLPLQDRGHPPGQGGRRDAERPALSQGLRRSDHPAVGLRRAGPAGEGRGDHARSPGS